MKTINEKGLQKEFRPLKKEDAVLCPKLRNHFVIHEHFAKRSGLHYDIRLEHNCVLKSWACRKLPAAVDQQVKVSAIQVQDHTLRYFNFEGKIEFGYGQGKVNIWDTGTYDLVKWSTKTIVVNFNGSKLKGRYVFVRVGNKTWLFFKSTKE